MRIVSLFTGAGGLDLGFARAGFDIVWANEYDRAIWETFEGHFPTVRLDRRSIADIPSTEIPDADGIVGGPPCQSWSEFGAKRGIADQRGQLFWEYARVLGDKGPRFFLAENVSGILASRHASALKEIVRRLENAGPGYTVNYRLLNVREFNVPQDRERVIFVGYRRDLGRRFSFPDGLPGRRTLRDAIWDLRGSVVPALPGNRANRNLLIPNHEYFEGTYSPHYMSRNRVRGWDEPSFTVQAGARHAPIHPQASMMVKVGKDLFEFDRNTPAPYRRLSVRECARVQTFPDTFRFIYEQVAEGYKMVGNAVPVEFARILAEAIMRDLEP